MRSIVFLLAFLLTSLLFLQCTKAIIDEESDTPNPGNLPESAVYNNDVKDIMFNYCITCHGGTAPSANLDLTSYTSVRQAAESGILQSRMNSVSSPMPASGLLSEDLRLIIDKWVLDGYPEN